MLSLRIQYNLLRRSQWGDTSQHPLQALGRPPQVTQLFHPKEGEHTLREKGVGMLLNLRHGAGFSCLIKAPHLALLSLS